MKKLAVFDLDGTLLDSLSDIARCTNRVLEQNGLPTHPADSYRFFVGGGLKVLMDKAIPAQHLGTPLYDKISAEYTELYNYVCAHESHAFAGIVEMLRKLKEQGIITAVATNKPDAMCKMVLADVYPGCIDIAYGQREDIARKPDPEVVYRIMADAGITDKNEVIYVGDSNVDIFTGLNAGVTTVGVLWGFRPKEELVEAGATILCETVDQLYNTIVE